MDEGGKRGKGKGLVVKKALFTEDPNGQPQISQGGKWGLRIKGKSGVMHVKGKMVNCKGSGGIKGPHTKTH